MLRKIIWAVGAIAALWLSYVLWYVMNTHRILTQTNFVFGWPFMSAWPIDLLRFGILVIGIAAVVYARKVIIGVVAGYTFGHIMAMLFHSDTFDSNSGTYMNNAWIIWTGIYLVCIGAGIVMEYIKKIKNKGVKE